MENTRPFDTACTLADPPHLTDRSAYSADPGVRFAVRQQWARFLRTCALRNPPERVLIASRVETGLDRQAVLTGRQESG